jgi:hypothetical protein
MERLEQGSSKDVAQSARVKQRGLKMQPGQAIRRQVERTRHKMDRPHNKAARARLVQCKLTRHNKVTAMVHKQQRRQPCLPKLRNPRARSACPCPRRPRPQTLTHR